MSMMRPSLLIGALILLLETTPIFGADFSGRLFTTDQERHDLNMLRLVKPEPQSSLVHELPKTKNFRLTLQGIVYRSDGKHQLWWDQPQLLETDIALDRIDPDKIYLHSTEHNKSIILRAGQTYIARENQAVDLWLGNGKLTVTP